MKKILESLKKRNNVTFYVTLVSEIIVAIQLVAVVFGHGDLITEAMKNDILAAANAVLLVLATLGVVNNPTSPGLTSKNEDE